jgi:hypothetical protein
VEGTLAAFKKRRIFSSLGKTTRRCDRLLVY